MATAGSKTGAARSSADPPPTPTASETTPTSAPRERTGASAMAASAARTSAGRPDDVLSQPTRARLFARLASLGRPVATGELAAELGLHPSGVRVHLERLRAAGLISRERLPQLRGRPRDGWRVAVDSRPAGQPPDAYPRLAAWLARSIPTTPASLGEVERVGREAGRGLVAGQAAQARERPSAEPPAEAFGRALTALGFAPRRPHAREEQTICYELRSCPYREAASENPLAVCALHRGITLGMLDRLAPAARLRRFVPQEPSRAGCLIEVDL